MAIVETVRDDRPTLTWIVRLAMGMRSDGVETVRVIVIRTFSHIVAPMVIPRSESAHARTVHNGDRRKRDRSRYDLPDGQ